MDKVPLKYLYTGFLFLYAVPLFILISCKPQPNNESTSRDTTYSPSSVPGDRPSLSGCYSMIEKRDTAMLNLQVVDSSVTGTLEYRRFEKDRNKGTIEGVVRGNMIIAYYRFQSEGVTSVREAAFLMRHDSLFEAYGEIVLKRDTTKFVNPGQLKFMEAAFAKVVCGN